MQENAAHMNRQAIREIKGFMVDLDGTVYLGDRLLPGADDFYRASRACGKRVLFLTNNSSRGPAEYQAKLRALGIPAEKDEVFTSGEATLIYLEQRGCRSIYPLATADFRSLMTTAGFELTDDEPDYVVLGFDTELTYEKIKTACRLLMNGAKFVVSHPDLLCPTAEGPVPDAGSMLAMITAATGREPEMIVGKPNPLMLELALERLGTDKASSAMIGDRISTDVAMASDAGITSILVLTTGTAPEEIERSPYRIDHQFESIADIAQLLSERNTA